MNIIYYNCCLHLQKTRRFIAGKQSHDTQVLREAKTETALTKRVECGYAGQARYGRQGCTAVSRSHLASVISKVADGARGISLIRRQRERKRDDTWACCLTPKQFDLSLIVLTRADAQQGKKAGGVLYRLKMQRFEGVHEETKIRGSARKESHVRCCHVRLEQGRATDPTNTGSLSADRCPTAAVVRIGRKRGSALECKPRYRRHHLTYFYIPIRFSAVWVLWSRKLSRCTFNAGRQGGLATCKGWRQVPTRFSESHHTRACSDKTRISWYGSAVASVLYRVFSTALKLGACAYAKLAHAYRQTARGAHVGSRNSGI